MRCYLFCSATEFVCASWRCPQLNNLDAFKKCDSLQKLEIGNCDNMTHIAGSDLHTPSNLERLEIRSCDRLKSLKGIEKFRNLEKLTIANCEQLSDISQLTKHPGIKWIHFYSCPKLTDPSFIRDLKDVSSVSFGRTPIPVEALKKLAEEVSVRIILDGKEVE